MNTRVRNLLMALAALLLVAVVPVAGPALAGAADGAKAAGQLGEQPNGYLGVLPGAPPAAAALARDINARRRAHYMAIAKKNGTNLGAVQAIVGARLIAKMPPGTYIKDASGRWIRK